MIQAVGLFLFVAMSQAASAQVSPVQANVPGNSTKDTVAAKKGGDRSYVLGPDDQITIRALHVEEIPIEPMRIGSDGSIRLPLAGRIVAAGNTVDEFEQLVMARLKPFVVDPQVSVSVTEFRSEPVSVWGAVKNPGIYQLQGRKTLSEMLSMAGGLDPAAGSTVKITRPVENGPVPLPGAAVDPTGKYNVAEVNLPSILKAEDPAANISIEARDVITVPRAEMIYVMGQVQKAGGFVLTDAKTMTMLQALSLAGGLGSTASPKHAMLLRPTSGAAAHEEVPVNLNEILAGKAPDRQMSPGDILLVPNSAPKRAALRAVEAAIQTGTGVVIWRR